MKYQIICTENDRIVAEAKRINDPFLVQETISCLAGGFFKDDTVKIFCDQKEISPILVIDKDEKRIDKWFARKSETHKLVYVKTGVCCLPQNSRKVWVKK